MHKYKGSSCAHAKYKGKGVVNKVLNDGRDSMFTIFRVVLFVGVYQWRRLLLAMPLMESTSLIYLSLLNIRVLAGLEDFPVIY